MKKLYTISEVSKSHGISCHTLRHYDKVGIFKPAIRDEETGYRYYKGKQFGILDIIIHLRSMKISIELIREHLSKLSYSYTHDLIDEQIKTNRIEIEKLLKTERKLLKEKEFFHELMTAEEKINKPFIEKKNSSKGIVIKVKDDSRESVHQGFKEIGNILENKRWRQENSFGFLIKEKNLKKKDLKVEFMVVFKEVENFEDSYTLKEGRYVCMYEKHDLHRGKCNYDFLFNWIEEKGYEICGDMFIELFAGPDVARKEREFIQKLKVPIK